MLKQRMGVLAMVCLLVALCVARAGAQGGTAPAQQQARAVAEPEAPRVVLQAETTASVLRLMKFSGALRDRADNPRTGAVGLTFALYKDQQGGSPLWLEVHNAQLDEQGRYTVLLGSTRSEGLPLELFASGEARWLAVQAQLPGEEEQARVLLVSVPYALKAADAETLGGKPPSAFVLAEKAEAAGKGEAEVGKEAVKEGPERPMVISGTVGKIAKFVGPNPDDVGNSVMSESGAGDIGVNNASPTAKLDVVGGFSVAAFRGNSTDAVMTFQNQAAGGGSWDLVATATGSGAGGGKFSLAKTGVAHYFTIDGMGNVGFSNVSPAAKLDVVGGFSVAAFRGNSTDAVMTFQNQATGGGSWDMVATATGSVAGGGKFSIAKTGVAHYFTIDGSGNVGVGNVNPTQKLDVQGNVKISGGGNGIMFPDGTTQSTAGVAAGTAINPQQVALLRWYAANRTGITFPVGSGPWGVAFDGANIWVAHHPNVTKLRASDGTSLGTFAVGTNPTGVAFDGANIWVANSGSNNVTKLRSDGFNLGTFAVGTSPHGLAFDGRNIWVANLVSNNVTKLQEGFNVGIFAVGTGPEALAFDGANIWVANNSSNNVTKLRASDGFNLGTFAVGTSPRGVAFDGANIWVANFDSHNVTKLRASDGANLGTFAVGTNPFGVAFDGANIWVANQVGNNVTKLRASDGANLGAFAVGTAPIGVAFDGASIWVTNGTGNTVSKL